MPDGVKGATICSTRVLQADVVRVRRCGGSTAPSTCTATRRSSARWRTTRWCSPSCSSASCVGAARRPAGAQRTWLGWYSLFQISLHRWDARIAAVAAAVVAARRRLVPGGRRRGTRSTCAATSRGPTRRWRCSRRAASTCAAGRSPFSSHACQLPWNDEYQAACDGDQGYDIARCLAGPDPRPRAAPPTPAEGAVDLFDLSERKFCRYPDDTAACSTRTRVAGAKSTWRMSTPSSSWSSCAGGPSPRPSATASRCAGRRAT